jgi:hypothetical protein
MIFNLLFYFIPCCLGDCFLSFEGWIEFFFFFFYFLITVLDDHMVTVLYDHMVVLGYLYVFFLGMRFQLVWLYPSCKKFNAHHVFDEMLQPTFLSHLLCFFSWIALV